MQLLSRFALGTLLSLSIGAESFAMKLRTEDEKLNYALGFEAGRDLKQHSLPFKSRQLVQGAKDGFSGRTNRLKAADKEKWLAVLRQPAEPKVRVLSISGNKSEPAESSIVPVAPTPAKKPPAPGTQPTPAEIEQATIDYLQRRVRGR